MVEATKGLIGGLKEIWRWCADYTPSFRPRLAKVTKTIVAKHVHGNQALKNYRYPAFRRLFETFRKYWVRTILGIVIAYAAVLAVTWISPLPGPPAPEKITDYFRDFQAINLSLLGAQASFVGLVFPLVIAFVGLLGQGNTASSERLGVYFQETSAVLTGASSLALCFAILLQLPFAAIPPVRVIAASAVLNLVWLAFNLVLLAHFLFRTMEYLRPKARTRLQKEYLANVAWPAELTRLVFQNRWQGAAHYGYLPGNPKDEEDGDDILASKSRVYYGYAFFDDDPPVAIRKLKRDHEVIDVRFGLLRRLVLRWQAGAGDGKDRRTLSFPLGLGQSYRGDTNLCRSTDPAGWAFRHHAGRVFRFARIKEVDGATTSTALLAELMSDAIALLESGRADEFAAQLRAVLDLHAFLFEIAQSPVEDFNYAAMEDERGRLLATSWAREYRDLQKRAVDVMVREPVFFGHCCYIGSGLMRRLDSAISPEQLRSLNILGFNAYYHLTNWAAGRYRDHGGSTGNPGALQTLPAGVDETYAAAVRDFVAGWESLLSAEAEKRQESNTDWAGLTRRRDFLLHHLRLTAEMVGKSVWLGDKVATQWSADMLMKWVGSAGVADYNHGRHWWALRRDNPTAALLGQPWADVLAQTKAVDDGEPDPRDVFSVACANTVSDYTVVLSTILVHWAVQFGGEGAAGLAARMLLRQQPHDSGGTGHIELTPFTAASVLGAIWRIVGSSEPFERGYAAQFEEFAERLGDFGEAPWISARIYSGTGGFGFARLYSAHILTMMACVPPGEPAITEGLKRLFVGIDDASRRRRQDYLRDLQREFENVKYEIHAPVLQALVSGQGPELSFDERLNWVKGLVRQLLAEVEQRRVEDIRQAPIDPLRLRAIAEAASAKAFGPNGAFPLPLFARIVIGPENFEQFKVSLANQQKGALTNPLMAQPVSNEREWWGDTMKGQVASVIFRDVVRKTQWQEREGYSPDQFWSSLKDAIDVIKNTGKTPIIVTASDYAPPWLADWHYPHRETRVRRPADMQINRDESEIEGYRFSINGIPLFISNAPAGVVCVLAKEALEQCSFHDFGLWIPISVSFVPSADDPWTGTTWLAYQHDVIVGAAPAFMIRYVAKGAPARAADGEETGGEA